MIAGNKIFAHLGNGKKPVTADIFLTDYCNNACPYCNYVRYENRRGEYMPFEDFERYTHKLLSLGVQGLILTGGGEPTLNPHFDRITAFLERLAVPYGLNTNFNIYTGCHPEFLKVSFDGYNKESYQRRRGVDAYDKVIWNIEHYAPKRGKTKLGLQMLATDASEVKKFYLAHHELDFDYMVFRPVESCGGKYYADVDEMEKRQAVIYAVKALSVIDKRVVLNYKFDHIGEKISDCPAHWSQLCLNVYGEVMCCCHKPNAIVGHIMDDDILEKHNNYKIDTTICDIPCRLSGPNATMRELESIRQSKGRMFI